MQSSEVKHFHVNVRYLGSLIFSQPPKFILPLSSLLYAIYFLYLQPSCLFQSGFSQLQKLLIGPKCFACILLGGKKSIGMYSVKNAT